MKTNKQIYLLIISVIVCFLFLNVLLAQNTSSRRITKLEQQINGQDEKKREKAIKKLIRRYKNYNSSEQRQAVKLVSKYKSKNVLEFLVSALRGKTTKKVSTRDLIAEIFIRGDYVGAEAVIAEALAKYPSMQRSRPIVYIGKKQFIPAIPLLQSYIYDNEYLYESFGALADIKNNDSYDYLEKQCFIYEYRFCYPCLTAIAKTKKVQPFLERMDSIMIQALKKYQSHPPQCVKIAYDYFINSNHNPTGRALARLVASRFPKDIGFVKAKKKKGRRFGVYPKDYVRRLIATIAQTTGLLRANEIYQQIETGLTENLRTREDIRNFVKNAYRTGFKMSQAKARLALEKGSRYPGSVHIIGRYVTKQYKTKNLQIYSLMKVLKISRDDAVLIYDIAKRDKLVY